MKRRRSYIRISLMLCVLGILLMTGCSPQLPLNQKYSQRSFSVNYGQTVPTDVGEYIDLDALSEEDRTYVEENSRVEYDGEKSKGKDYDKPGTYSLTIYYEDQQYRQYEVTVIDTEPPKFTKAEDMYLFAGTDISEEELEEMVEGMFKAKDNSGKVKLDISHDPISTEKVHDYTVRATATDKHGNMSKKTATFHIQKAEYGAQGTYIYVSIPKQTLTYFVDGEIDMETPIVSGTAGSHDTPYGTYYINSMSMNTRLKGQDYDVTVAYWMAFIGGEYGLHSAQWRGSFGGNIYQYSGSHGCVNMPTYAAGELFNKADIGTPVIIGN